MSRCALRDPACSWPNNREINRVRIELALLPFAIAAVALCAGKTLKKFPAGNAAIAWGAALSALMLLAIILLLQLLQD